MSPGKSTMNSSIRIPLNHPIEVTNMARCFCRETSLLINLSKLRSKRIANKSKAGSFVIAVHVETSNFQAMNSHQ